MHFRNQCGATNDAVGWSGAICERPRNHTGNHLQLFPPFYAEWPFPDVQRAMLQVGYAEEDAEYNWDELARDIGKMIDDEWVKSNDEQIVTTGAEVKALINAMMDELY